MLNWRNISKSKSISINQYLFFNIQNATTKLSPTAKTVYKYKKTISDPFNLSACTSTFM